MLFVQHQCFWFQKNKVEKHQFLVKRGVATKRFFFWTCVLENVKSYRFFCPIFCQILVDVQKHYKNRYFSTFLKAKNWKKKMHFEVLLSGPSRCYYLGQVDCNLKMANLAQIITPQICARNFVFKKKSAETPIFIVFFGKHCFVKSKLGPDNNTSKGQTWPR